MELVTFCIDTKGTLTFLNTETTRPFLNLGEAKTRRASHVEPNNFALRILFHGLRRVLGDKGRMSDFTRRWPILWRVNLSPVGGPILFIRYRDRQAAIRAEVEWLNARIDTL